MSQNNKRASIIELIFFPNQTVRFQSVPGSDKAAVSGLSKRIKVHGAELKETFIQGEEVNQQFSAVSSDVSVLSSSLMRRSMALPGIWVLRYSNDSYRAVGTDQFPVVMTIEESGRPAVFKLSFKRTCPEPSKFLESF